uniref:non-specific serine/threonine protein kinase n=1 Tax=Zooxanthella nutricula TaxID=1333877 RepID=A0A7S2I8K5_9DINO
MGTVSAGACATVEPTAAKPEPTGHDLEVFDRSTLAQVKTGNLHNNYEVLEELGSGSFGVVNKGRDIRNKDRTSAAFVAVKTIPKKKISDPKKIKEEFNVLRQLDHAHICKAYECYEDRRNIYLVMDICTGGTLLETLCRQSRFSENDAANVMRQILSALSYLHEANFVFRDLKTENIMFSSPLQSGVVGCIKLIDFGLCCPFERGTKIAKAAGTPYSVAPELVTAPVQYDQRCDAWSAGVVMYIILSGQYPFRGKTKDELLNRIRRDPVSFKDKSWRKVSKDAKTLLAELLRKKAESRCEVCTALEHPWLRNAACLPEANILEDVVDTMMHFQTLNMLQKAAITALAWRASDADTQHLRQIFEALDRDGNGHITVPELRDAFDKAGVQIPSDISFASMGTDGNDTIEYTEFLALALDKRKVLKEDVVWEAFKVFDSDGSGTVTKKELCKILTGRTSDKIRQVHGEKAIEAFLDSYDTSDDGVIDFDEFLQMLSAGTDHTSPTSARRRRDVVGSGDGTGRLVGRVLDLCTLCGVAHAAGAGKGGASNRPSRYEDSRMHAASSETEAGREGHSSRDGEKKPRRKASHKTKKYQTS